TIKTTAEEISGQELQSQQQSMQYPQYPPSTQTFTDNTGTATGYSANNNWYVPQNTQYSIPHSKTTVLPQSQIYSPPPPPPMPNPAPAPQQVQTKPQPTASPAQEGETVANSNGTTSGGYTASGLGGDPAPGRGIGKQTVVENTPIPTT